MLSPLQNQERFPSFGWGLLSVVIVLADDAPASAHCLSSMSAAGVFVNDWQREMFKKYRRKRRDPMWITAAVLMELEGFPSLRSLRRYCEKTDLEALTRKEQWLFDGMDGDAVAQAFVDRLQTSGSFMSRHDLDRRRRERAEEDAKEIASSPPPHHRL